VRVIGADGEQVGVMSVDEALKLSTEAALDLVEVVPNAEPPVCRIMDYGKFKFEQSKKAQVSRKKQVRVHVKEVKFRPGTEEADYQVKMRNLRRFIDHGDKVKVSLRFRGREMAHQDLGAKLLKRVEEDLGDEVVVEQRPLMEGRVMVMMLNGKKK
jgi:translation initiation factor IF-3